MAAARGGAAGEQFLTDILMHCPWAGGTADTQLIAAIQEPSLSGTAAEAWAARWAMTEPEAARSWAETLPSAARARALAGLWRTGASPAPVLSACAEAGTTPDIRTLAVMSQEAPEITLPWIASQPGSDAWHIAGAARGWAATDPAAAASWAAQLPDPEQRVRVVTGVMQEWAGHAPQAAMEWLAGSPLDEEARTFVSDLTGF